MVVTQYGGKMTGSDVQWLERGPLKAETGLWRRGKRLINGVRRSGASALGRSTASIRSLGRWGRLGFGAGHHRVVTGGPSRSFPGSIQAVY
jgi:hypothetical protein